MSLPLWGSPPEHLGTSVQRIDYGRTCQGVEIRGLVYLQLFIDFLLAAQGGRSV